MTHAFYSMRRHWFHIPVYIAYVYFLLFGGIWFFVNLIGTGRFNITSFIIVAVFAVQAWFRNKLTNLILGIISLFMSIFMLLDTISIYKIFDKKAPSDSLAHLLLTFACISIGMSLILIFSYMMLNLTWDE